MDTDNIPQVTENPYLRLLLVLIIIGVLAAGFVFVILPAVDAFFNPPPLPPLKPPVKI